MASSRASNLRHRLVGLLPAEQQVKVYKWFKTRILRQRIGQSGIVVISYPKSGRTWFRIMLSRCYAGTHGLDENTLLKDDNFHRLNAQVPVISWFHGKFIAEISGSQEPKAFLDSKKIVFLVRNPIDVTISTYFHLFGGRAKPEKRAMQGIPASMDELPIDQFVLTSKWSVRNIVTFMNEWAALLDGNPQVLMVRYEDMRKDAAGEMERVNRFLGGGFSAETIAKAVTASSFENLKEQERSGTIANAALKPRNADDPNSFKVRRGKVGGYVDYLKPETIAEVERIAAEGLSPTFGYSFGGGAQPPG